MAAVASDQGQRSIRVYCPTHKIGFTTLAKATIECASQSHHLATDFPNETFWQYCCDCQHYSPNETDRAVDCPACDRQIVRRFLCGECRVISAESDKPGRRKTFALSSHGVPTPTCPGCLSLPGSAVQEHSCADFGDVLVTPRSVCPFCDDALELPASFPCSVTQYLESLNRPTATARFDPQSNTLQESAEGDFVVVSQMRESSTSIVIPKGARFSSKRDYYDIYYELFNCDNAAAGEVIILSAAIVEKCESGWLVKEPGTIQIKSDEWRPAGVSEGTIRCANCGTVGNPAHEFCGRCGTALNDTASFRHITNNVAGQGDQTFPSQSQATSPYATSFALTDQPAATAEFSGGSASLPLDDFDSALGSSAPAIVSARATKPIAAKFVLGTVAGAFVLIVIIAIALSSSGGNSVEKQLDEAITRSNLFPPAPQNAHDLYNQLKSSNASEEILRRYRERLIPLLTSQPDQLLTDLVQIGSEEPTSDQWQEAAKRFNWAAELNPADSKVAAKAAYSEGRAAYVQDKKSEGAIQSWNRAASLDKSWALPVNGMGLIYQSRDDHANSKSYFLRAMNLAPNWPHPYENLGNDYFDAKDYSNAKDYYQKALEKAPDWAKPHWHLAQIAMQLNDYSTAVTEFEAALSPNAKGLKGNEPRNVQKGLDLARQKLARTTSVSSF